MSSDRRLKTSPAKSPAAPPPNLLSLSQKSTAASPKLDSQMEMGSLPQNPQGETPPSQEDQSKDVMQLARVGDVPAMEKLFEAGEYDATYHDDENITPLHWAAINNQYAMCKFLIEHGAEINRKGGESVATPLQWAAQRCHYYTVNLLLQHGADPLITDAQGYNTLHISTFNGNALLLVLLLHQGIPVDVLDSFGHTSLMWAAYKGFPQCVDLFLRWGASVHATDEQGFTALHWALVKGNQGCIQKLIEFGADRFAKTQTGKTPAITASELGTEAPWLRSLRECGFDDDGNVAIPPWPGASIFLKDRRTFVTRFTFFLPWLILTLMILIASSTNVFFGVPLAVVVGYGLQWCAQQVLNYAPPDMRQFHKTPWLTGIFAGTLFLTGVNWLTVLLPATTMSSSESKIESHLFLNLIFGTFLGLTAYFYIASMRYDPGFVPKMNGIAEQKAVIDELLANWKFDEFNFCVSCMIRTPLRSKHCKRCQRCVARHDHHCPWVYNCVGVNNHRHFFLYILNLTGGILSYDWLLYYYYDIISATASESCSILGPSLCKVVNADSYTMVLALWDTLQLVWVFMLVFTQLVQVSRAMTTYENMFGVQDGTRQTAFTSTGTPLDPNHLLPGAARGASAGDHHGHNHKDGLFKRWSRVLGVDPFIETITGRGAATGKGQKKNKNPYSRGCVVNCRDFWCDPAPMFGQRDNGIAILGGTKVDYMGMYESPALMRITGMREQAYEAVDGEEV